MALSIEDLTRGGTAAAGLFDQMGRMTEIGDQAVAGTQEIARNAIAGTEFKPFSVASNTGNVEVDAQGGISTQLGDAQQRIADTAAAGSAGLFASAAQDPAARQQAIFESIMAGIAPGQARDRTALDARLTAQGRQGISTADFGGSPEQFALAKAQEEARLGAFTQAQTLGMQEQELQGKLADLMGAASLRGDASLFNQAGTATNTSNLVQTGQIGGQNLASQAETTGLEAKIQAEKQRSDLVAKLYGVGSQVAGEAGSSLDELLGTGGDVVEYIRGLF